jgi:hypothetical protein
MVKVVRVRVNISRDIFHFIREIILLASGEKEGELFVRINYRFNHFVLVLGVWPLARE